jgi:hypothetical protein
MTRLLVAGVVVLLAGCTDRTPAPEGSATTSHNTSSQNPVATADSARAFTQHFYDWYLATKERHGEPYDSLLSSRRGWLADTLARAMQADIAMQRADTAAEIASLSAEADLFLNSQDPCARYTAGTPRYLGAEGFLIPVAGSCGGLETKPNVAVHVRQDGGRWVIVNVKDPADSKFDLLGALARYRAEMLSPQDSAGKDTSHAGSA